MTPSRSARIPSLVEVLISLAIIVLLLATLLPTLNQARSNSRQLGCQANLNLLGQSWGVYLGDHNHRFPTIEVEPAWHYAGVKFDTHNTPLRLLTNRPLNDYLPNVRGDRPNIHPLLCPGDCGIVSPSGLAGTGRRTCFRAFGTSYRANSHLFNAPSSSPEPSSPEKPDAPQGESQTNSQTDAHSPGLSLTAITATPSRLLLMGDPLWFEVAEETRRDATWHDDDRTGNFLFLDGSVRTMRMRPKRVTGPVVYDPLESD